MAGAVDFEGGVGATRAAGLVCVSGAGRRFDPHRYWLPGDEARLLPPLEPLEPLEEMERGALVRVAERALARRPRRS